MPKFMELLEDESNITYTENGAKSFIHTQSAVLDLFSVLGASRKKSVEEIETLVQLALNEDELLTLRALFYARDIREGLGERRIFRIAIKYIASIKPMLILDNLYLISEYGRYDDLLCLLDCKELENDIYYLIKTQLQTDIINTTKGKPISLLCKWLPSNNTSSGETKRYAYKIIKGLNISPKTYRKILSKLRKYINLIERLISSNDWQKVEYENVPSKAMLKYTDAFKRHDSIRYDNYIESVKKGESKINVSTIYPYEILHKANLITSGWGNISFKLEKDYQYMWDALPNYVEPNTNVLVMADTSGSMCGTPMEVALSLAIYFAERNTGEYKDKFITFSSEPSFVKLTGNTLQEKIRCVPSIVENTDLERALMLVLDTAVNNNLKQEDFPKSLIVISDMEFDYCVIGNNNDTFLKAVKDVYKEKGYEMPNIIFWNVESRQQLVHARMNDKGVQLVSGASPSVFSTVMSIIGKTPYEAMMTILNSDRYNAIKL